MVQFLKLAVQPILILGSFIRQQRNKTQILNKLKALGSGTGEEENWMLSMFQLFGFTVSSKAENVSVSILSANAEMSAPYKV